MPAHLKRNLLAGVLLVGSMGAGCAGVDRDNPFDPAAPTQVSLTRDAAITLAVPLPKALATVVDSLVARLDVPDAPTVIKNLTYDTPLGPALLTIGALSPGGGITLTIEGYDLDGRLILTGTQSDITIAANDTTRVSIDLRLTIDLEDPDDGDTVDDGSGDGSGDDTTDPTDGGDAGAGDDTGTDDPAVDDGTDAGTDTGDTGADPGADTGEATGSDTGEPSSG